MTTIRLRQDDGEGEGEDGNEEDAKDMDGKDEDDDNGEEGDKDKEGFESLAPEDVDAAEEEGEELKEDEQQPQVN